jgi:hypothetical protein
MPEVTTVDPSTGQVLATYPAADLEGVKGAIPRIEVCRALFVVPPSQPYRR